MADRADERRRRRAIRAHRRSRRARTGRVGLIRRAGRRLTGLRLPRLRTLLLWVVGLLTTVMVTGPAAAADDTDKYKPSGIGDLMPSPIKPKGQGTLFESHGPDVYQLDKQLSDSLTGGDLID